MHLKLELQGYFEEMPKYSNIIAHTFSQMLYIFIYINVCTKYTHKRTYTYKYIHIWVDTHVYTH